MHGSLLDNNIKRDDDCCSCDDGCLLASCDDGPPENFVICHELEGKNGRLRMRKGCTA